MNPGNHVGHSLTWKPCSLIGQDVLGLVLWLVELLGTCLLLEKVGYSIAGNGKTCFLNGLGHWHLLVNPLDRYVMSTVHSKLFWKWKICEIDHLNIIHFREQNPGTYSLKNRSLVKCSKNGCRISTNLRCPLQRGLVGLVFLWRSVRHHSRLHIL